MKKSNEMTAEEFRAYIDFLCDCDEEIAPVVEE